MAPPPFESETVRFTLSPGSITALPIVGVAITVPSVRYGCGTTPRDARAAFASAVPKPVVMSYPGVSISVAVDVSAFLICAGVADGATCFRSAAIAAACGAAADVP